MWQILAMAIPLMLQNMSQTLLGVTDTYFVSQIGTDALAAVALGSVIYFSVMMLFRNIANSTMIFVGRAHGGGDNAKIGIAIWRCLNTIVWFSLPVFGLPWFFSWLMGYAAPVDSPDVGIFATIYLQIRAFEIPLLMFSTVVWGFMVGRGDSRTPMILAWVTVLFNIFLDWVFVLGNLGAPALGVQGAAYATVIANLLNATLSAFILWNPESRKLYGTGKARLVSWPEIRNVLRIGVPMGLGDFIEIASFSVFLTLMGRLGANVLAANQIALQFMSISFTLGIGISMATSSLISQYLGAKDPGSAEKVGYRAMVLAMTSMGCIGLVYFFVPELLISVFSQDETVIAAGAIILTLMAVYQIVDAMGIVVAGALNGAGDTTFTMWVRSILALGLFLPLAWTLLFIFEAGVGGGWLGAVTYLGSKTAIYLIRFRSGRWKNIEVG